MLALATFVTFLSSHLITPIVPVLAGDLGAENLDIVTVSGSYVVLLASSQIFTGALADRYGKRRMIALGAFLGASSSILCTAVSSWEQLLVLRGLGGVADAVAGPALLALVAELSGKQKGKAMGIFRSSQGLAFIIGPALGGAVAHFSTVYAPFYMDFSLTLLGILLFILKVPEAAKRRDKPAHKPLEAIRLIGHDLRLVKIAFLGFSEMFAFAALSSFVPATAISFGMSEIEIAALFTAEATVFTVTNLAVGTLSDRTGRKPILILGLASSSATLAAFFFTSELWQILLLMGFYGFGSSSVYVMSSTMAADMLPEENKAMLFGTFDAIMDIGMVTGPSVCYTFLATFGWPIHYSFLFMTIPSIFALGVASRIYETKAWHISGAE